MTLLPGEPDTSMPARAEGAYRVLARKYRPTDFDGLIGQEAMVRTLGNAIRESRIAHAFLLTGVRGVGKTTTARIIARSLNCVGPDGRGGPTVKPCGVCEVCEAISESRHVDVLEMDAASRTGVGDIRELLDGVRYAPASARFKVYIIDEVHMLSNQAFNALLKTLEEPPAHVKFVFATTEVRKLPVTVLSRCQRFDLRRVDVETLVAHLGRIAGLEQVPAEPDALALIAQAAEGSVRDALSLLDQAIVHGDGRVEGGQVRAMLGLADRAIGFDLLEATLGGDPARALSLLRELYAAGADPAVAIQDLLDIVHWLTRLKVLPGLGEDPSVAELERRRGAALAAQLSMPVLARAWQMLLKGLGEVRQAPAALAAAEMVLVRLAYGASLPPPAEILKRLEAGDGAAASPPAPSRTRPAPAGPQAAVPQNLADVAALADARREGRLAAEIREHLRVVRFEPGRLTIRPTADAAPDLAGRLGRKLAEWTGVAWTVVVDTQGAGEATLAEQAAAAGAAARAELTAHPLVRAALSAFPGAEIVEVRDVGDPAARRTGEGSR